MNLTILFAFLIVLVLGITYIKKGSDNPPESGMTQTPKEYIQQVERLKEAKKAAQELHETQERQTQQADKALEVINRQR